MNIFREYIEKIPAVIQKYAGRYVVQGIEPMVLEGNCSPGRMVVIEFPSRQMAENFYADPEAQSLFKLRHQSSTSRLVLAQGCVGMSTLPVSCCWCRGVSRAGPVSESRIQIILVSKRCDYLSWPSASCSWPSSVGFGEHDKTARLLASVCSPRHTPFSQP